MRRSISDLPRTPNKKFNRPAENILMLEHYLAGLEARYVTLSGKSNVKYVPAMPEAGKVVERYRAYRAARASGGSGASSPLPD